MSFVRTASGVPLYARTGRQRADRDTFPADLTELEEPRAPKPSSPNDGRQLPVDSALTNTPRRAARVSGPAPKQSVQTRQPSPEARRSERSQLRFNPADGADRAELRLCGSQIELFAAWARTCAKLGIMAGIAVLLFLLFAAARSWLLSAPKTDTPDDVRISTSAANPAPRTPPPAHHSPDTGRTASHLSPLTISPEQKPTIAIVIPRNPLADEAASAVPAVPVTLPGPSTASEPAEPAAAPQPLDLTQPEEAKRVQQRLIELGFLVGTADGVWGPRSRRALQDFRVALKIGNSDTWDEATEELLFADTTTPAAEINYIGGWGVDLAQCRQSPLIITVRRAEAFGATCEFKATQRESSNEWRLQAACTSNRERWNAKIRFTVSADQLTWASERGTVTYTRCVAS